jgi:hypothetical protein
MKIRVTKCFPGVRDGEHQARVFLPGCCYELADDGATPPAAFPGSLLAVALAENWAAPTEKGTPTEPQLMAEAGPQTQRLMADNAAQAAAIARVEAHDLAVDEAQAADEALEAAETAALANVEDEAAARALAHAKENKAKTDAALKASQTAA